jgi:hypothetical protein
MQAGVDHQAAGAQHFGRQRAEVVVRVLVEAHLVAEALGVERPTFLVGVVAGRAPEERQVAQLERSCDLQVVAGHRLMQQRGFHLVRRAVLEVVDVGVEVAGAASIHRGLRVVVGVVALVGVHRADAVGRARQLGEERRQLRVGALGDVAVGGQSRLGRAEEEARIGVDEIQELRERALEAGLRDHRVHLAADTRDLPQPDRMDLVGRERRGRRLAHPQRIVGRAGGQRRGREFPGGRGQIFSGEEAPVRRECGMHLFLQHAPSRLGPAALLFRAHLRRKLRERLPQRGGGDIGAGEFVEHRRHALDRGLRRHPPALHAGAHRRDLLLERHRHRVEALQVIVVVARAPEGRGLRERGHPALRAVHRRHRHPALDGGERQVAVERALVAREAQVGEHHVARDAVLGRELLRVEALELGDHPGDACLAPRHGLR